MNPQLVDKLVCPRCGPPHGLVLLAQNIVEGRVRDGTLGCPNCRYNYEIADGWVDLRRPPHTYLGPLAEFEQQPWESYGVALALITVGALDYIEEYPRTILMAVGERLEVDRAAVAVGVSRLLGNVEVVDVIRQTRVPDKDTVSGMVTDPEQLPFRDGTFDAVVVSEHWVTLVAEEANRVLGPAGKVVVVPGRGSCERDEALFPGFATVADSKWMWMLERPAKPAGGPRLANLGHGSAT